MRNWRILLQWLLAERPAATSSPADVPLSLSTAIDQYEKALESTSDSTHILQCLLARDAVAAALQQTREPSPEQTQRLAALDTSLRQEVATVNPDTIHDWCQALNRPDSAWWWFPDRQAEEREKRQDLLWVLLSSTLMGAATVLALELIKRFWDGAPDIISIAGTILIVLLTTSPLTKQGRDVARWLQGRVFRLRPQGRATAMMSMSLIALMLMVGAWLLLPWVARQYNNAGLEKLRAGSLAAAQRHFQRAIALSPDLVVPYYNLGDGYEQIGLYDDAASWYKKAIERDRDFIPAYRGLGHVYNLQGAFEKAEPILLAGLSLTPSTTDSELDKVVALSHYAVLADLGWTYYAQKRFERAQDVLEEAIRLEAEIKTLGEREGTEYRIALPHYYLAQIYEQLGLAEKAKQQWNDTLRLVGSDNWADREWVATAQQRLQTLEKAKP
jgi:tetratricopeptide (TPR) repeat protein